MLRGPWLAIAFGVAVLGCGGEAKDETRLADTAPQQGTPQTSIGAEQPAHPASSPTASSAPNSEAVGAAQQAPSGKANAEPQASPAETPDPETEAPIAELDCEPGAGRCNGVFAEWCSPERTWLTMQQCRECNGRSSCEVIGQGALCLTHICCYPEMRCSGQFLEVCNATSTGFEVQQDCGSGALCDSNRGACLAVCRPGETRCNGAELQQCTADRTGFETLHHCVTAALCRITERGAVCAGGCSAGETRCSGLTLQRCSDEQTGFETVEQCAAGCELGACIEADAGAAPQSAQR